MRVQSEEDTGLKENKNETNNLNKRAKDFNKLCTFCGRKGHIEPECYTKRRQLQRQSEVGCFWLKGPLRQYFSLYRAVSEREGERKEK